jgi:hypothetical protein
MGLTSLIQIYISHLAQLILLFKENSIEAMLRLSKVLMKL